MTDLGRLAQLRGEFDAGYTHLTSEQAAFVFAQLDATEAANAALRAELAAWKAVTREAIISCDGHLVEPLEALPAGSRYDGGGRLLILPDGYDCPALPVWTSVGNGTPGFGAGFKEPLALTDCPAAYDPAVREAYCLSQGVIAEVLYPTFAMVAVETANSMKKSAQAAMRFNDWARPIFQSPLFHPLLVLPALEPFDLKHEIEAVCDMFNPLPVGFLLPQQPRFNQWRDYVKAFAVAAEAGLPIHWHAFTRPSNESFGRDPLAQAWGGIRAAQDILLELILGGVFREVPTLKVVFAEMDVGWVWHFRGRLGKLLSRYGKVLAVPAEAMELDRIFAENVFFAVQGMDEITAMVNQDANTLWGWDYPHSDAVPSPFVMFKAQQDQIDTLNARAAAVYPRLAGVVEGVKP